MSVCAISALNWLVVFGLTHKLDYEFLTALPVTLFSRISDFSFVIAQDCLIRLVSDCWKQWVRHPSLCSRIQQSGENYCSFGMLFKNPVISRKNLPHLTCYCSLRPKLNLQQTGLKLASNWFPIGKMQLGYIGVTWFYSHQIWTKRPVRSQSESSRLQF